MAFCFQAIRSRNSLIYFGKRYYDPEFARWLTTDPAGFIDSVNLYQYVFNNPFRYNDPDGEFIQFLVPLLALGAEFVLPSLSSLIAPIIYGALTGAATYGGYKVFEALSDSGRNAAFNPLQKSYVNQYIEQKKRSYGIHKKKRGEIDHNLSTDPLNDPNLEDISHPNAKEKGHHKFKDKRTGEIIEYDKGKHGSPGHKGHDHYHRPNPDRTGKDNWYLDSKGKPVPDRSEVSHLYPPEWVWWQ